jgi:hypothetical protein
MKVRYQADADLNEMIVWVTIRREPSVDFQTASAGGIRGLADPEVLAEAARAGRVLVTHDQTTMPEHFGAFILGQESPGVLVIPQHVAVGEAAEELILIWAATEAEEWVNRICYLPL